MRGLLRVMALVALVVAIVAGSRLASAPDERAELLSVRESVWRAWFANDAKALEQLIPADTIVISSGEEKWKSQTDILQEAAQFQASGGKLLRLEFPRTEVQRFGDVAVTYSQYVYETEVGGKRSQTSGRVTEIFVLATENGPIPAGTRTRKNRGDCLTAGPRIGILRDRSPEAAALGQTSTLDECF